MNLEKDVKHWRPGYLTDEVRIDFLENQFDGEFETDLKALLSRSAEDATEIEKLIETKEALRASDDVSMPESGVYFDALEARIVGALSAAIEVGEIKDRRRRLFFVSAPRFVTPVRGWRAQTGHFALFGGLAVLLIGKWLLSGEGTANGQYQVRQMPPTLTEEVGAVRQAAPNVLASTVIGFESPSDIGFDLAARAIAQQTVAQKELADALGEN